MAQNIKYKRILLKLSGESLMGKQEFGIETEVLNYFADEIKSIHDLGVQVGIVIGGGNIYRGLNATEQGIDRVAGDQMGMLATMINSLALQNACENKGVFTRLISKKAGLLFSVPAPDCRISVPIRRLHCARWKLKPMQF